jgi:hypothetical protein
MRLPPFLAHGPLICRPNWYPFSKVRFDALAGGGIYAIGLPRAVQYRGGVSRIAYIGSTSDLRQRLMQHRRTANRWEFSQLEATFGELCFAIWPLEPTDKDWLFAVEGEALCYFERNYGRLPICNHSVPATPYARQIRDLVEVVGCDAISVLSFDDIAKAIVDFRAQPRYRPALLKKSITANEWFYEGVAWPSSEELATLVQNRELQELRFISLDEVAAWRVEKFQALLRISGALKRERSRGDVVRFQSGVRRIPRPHTWGEVALLQARLVTGCWLPENRVWLKVCCGRELLGQAIADSIFARGEDKSSLPQRTKARRRALPDLEAIEKALKLAAAAA